jgi:hypothetical protein
MSKYENRRMKPVEVVLRRGGGLGRTMGRVNLIKYVVSTYVNVTNISPCTTVTC